MQKTKCGRCGASMMTGARYCASCGNSLYSPQNSESKFITWWRDLIERFNNLLMNLRDKFRCMGLYRSSDEKSIAGVCAGLSHRFKWNLSLVRCLVVAGFWLIMGLGLIYIFAWLVLEAIPTRFKR